MFGLDVVLCQETWNESLDKLANRWNIPVPSELYSTHNLQNQHAKCNQLHPETQMAIRRFYEMDYCIFGYDDLPSTESSSTCPQSQVPPEYFTERYQVCSQRHSDDGTPSLALKGLKARRANKRRQQVRDLKFGSRST